MENVRQRFLIHDESENSHGYIIRTAGIDLEIFKKNPVMLYQHDKESNVIGKWENIEVVGTKIFADAVFDMDDENGSKIGKKVANGFLNATSIAVKHKDTDLVNNVLTKCFLFECSIVTFPANTNAVKVETLKMSDTESKTISIRKSTLSEVSRGAGTLKSNLISLFEMNKSATDDAIFDRVKIMHKQWEGFIEQMQKEAEETTDLAIKLGIIPSTLRTLQLNAFNGNFNQSKSDLNTLIAEKINNNTQNNTHAALREVILGSKDKTTLTGEKEKYQWNLDDYRKNSPKELSDNPELYKKLVDQKFNNKN